MTTPPAPALIEPRRVALVTLGCARNEVDSEELAGRLEADGWVLVEDAADADAVVVNTCGFVEAAKKAIVYGQNKPGNIVLPIWEAMVEAAPGPYGDE